jgi:hypothetical protein
VSGSAYRTAAEPFSSRQRLACLALGCGVTTPSDKRPAPNIWGLVAMAVLIGTASIVLLPEPGSYGVGAVGFVLLALGLWDSARRRRRSH